MRTELLVAPQGAAQASLPPVLDGVEWTTQRKSAPGKLTFRVRAPLAALPEGAAVRFSVDGQAVFFGFLFTRQCGADGAVAVTAYDQLRYLKNRDTLVYENKTAAQLLRAIAADCRLSLGQVEDTRHVIASRVEDNTTLLDMLENAIGLTVQNTGELFVLYDDAGKLTLKSLRSMLVGGPDACLLLEAAGTAGFEYTAGIDEAADRVKLIRENGAGGAREVYIAENGAHINAWGVLQLFEKLGAGENGPEKAEALLRLHDTPARSLTLRCRGDVRVRGGSVVAVSLAVGGGFVQGLLLVEKAVHTFRDGAHTMELTLAGVRWKEGKTDG